MMMMILHLHMSCGHLDSFTTPQGTCWNAWNALTPSECSARLQLTWLQLKVNMVFFHFHKCSRCLFGSLLMNPYDVLESLFSQEKLWFEEFDSSCQRT